METKKSTKAIFTKTRNYLRQKTDISKILLSKKEPYGKNGSVRYTINDHDVIRPLCIRPLQMIDYVNYFDNVKKMSFNVSDNKLLKIRKKIWEKVCSFMKIEVDSETVSGDKYIDTKIRSYKDKIDTGFYGKGIPKKNAACNCLSLIVLQSAIRASKKHYPQTFLEECNYEVKKKKMEKLINNLEQNLSDKSDSESDNEESND